ncbi:winged helix-turn-helix transcriptional regulator [Chitinophaga pinensis]|uniref:Transcriptional regulator, HxlR family n=1 Tax=Chitinophaga pinensis (strain ATCC 43595 / DSM 2588 / LMG 13176 / NBRC 15968 / NCIMB 11800 / UQM 2034) TaxID=485918 RepID=A0A979G9V3_CHIPD|nr:helix-turn-helix domain-containing protein [Chitinophaga pinensis]ACU63403.1 transcriptional regulator, HxlR family [Chitinophaga pinensis DSM 2588]
MAKIKATSTNNLNRQLFLDCSLTYALQLVGGRWKLLILMELSSGAKRYNELKKNTPNITERMLTLQLRELEADGLVVRKVYAEVPPKVEYTLTAIGHELTPICMQLHGWGERHKDNAASKMQTVAFDAVSVCK